MIIKDCIYRFIDIPYICKEIIDTFEFQRLRKIKQLGFVYLVYPSANHTRFEHSLGVMHLAGRVIDTLRTNGVEITDREKELVQVAGLLHDIGHVAFSHLLDDIFEKEELCSVHEDRSIFILKMLNKTKTLFNETEEKNISDMIKGIIPEDCTKPFLYEIVCNKLCGMDVDRMDYLQRDAYHTGLPGFQPDYLIQCVRVNMDGNLSFLRKAESEIRLLYDTRKRMFTLVYRHKTVLRIEKLVKGIINKEVVNRFRECLQTKEWLKFTDEMMWEWLVGNDNSSFLYTRGWEKDDVLEAYTQCSIMTEEEICERLSCVPFI
jgi:HD superfamily phosphohydrolase